jgi:electron transfer flavoprotein alpha subunit
MDKQIIVTAEHSSGTIMPSTYETLAFAIELRGITGMPVNILIAGKNISSIAEELATSSGFDVTALEGESLDCYSCEGYVSAIYSCATELNPAYICVPHTPAGYDFAPGLAVRLKYPCLSSVEKISGSESNIIFTRSIWHGKLKMDTAPAGGSAVITVLPGAFKFEGGITDKGKVSIKNISTDLKNTRNISIKASSDEDKSLNDAGVIVSAGRGMLKKENMALVHDLARVFTRSAVGGSRAACDAGWLDHRLQIGLTGRIVSPKLYIACGISGAVQHIAGIKGSQNIVAINRDPKAAIFEYADICVIDDVMAFIPAFIEEAKKRKTM